MSWVVCVWRMDFEEDFSTTYHDYTVGAFQAEDRAGERAEQIERALKRAGLDETYSVRVEWQFPTSYTTRDLIAFIAEDEQERARPRAAAGT